MEFLSLQFAAIAFVILCAGFFMGVFIMSVLVAGARADEESARIYNLHARKDIDNWDEHQVEHNEWYKDLINKDRSEA